MPSYGTTKKSPRRYSSLALIGQGGERLAFKQGETYVKGGDVCGDNGGGMVKVKRQDRKYPALSATYWHFAR